MSVIDTLAAHLQTMDGHADKSAHLSAASYLIGQQEEIKRLRSALTTCVNYADDMKVVVKTCVNVLSDKEPE